MEPMPDESAEHPGHRATPEGDLASSEVANATTDATRRGPPSRSLVIGTLLTVLLAIPVIRLSLLTRNASPPSNEAAIRLQGLIDRSAQLLAAGRYEESLVVAKQALVADPGSAGAYNNMAIAYMKLGKWDDAMASAREAIRLDPDFQLAKNNVAWIEAERAKAEGSPSARPPTRAEEFLALSARDFQAGRWKQSIDAAKEALKLDPNVAAAYNNMSAAYAKLGMWDEAIRNAREAIRLEPDFELAKNNLAAAEAGKGATVDASK
jgi:tetratricopeptide (TPR) repeat protein